MNSLLRKSTNNIMNLYYRKINNKKDKKIIKKNKNWIKLNNNELRIIRKENRKACIIFKNIYNKWNECDYQFFISEYTFQKDFLPKLNLFNYDRIGLKNKKGFFLDKNYQSLFIKNIKFPNTIYKCINGEFYDCKGNIITSNEAKSLLNKYEEVVCKISLESGHGKGVKKYSKFEYDNIQKEYKNNYIVQEIVKQCSYLNRLNSSSVNIIRITSLFWKSKIYIIGAIIRVGVPGEFCDHVSINGNNPRIAAINSNGNISNNIIDPVDIISYDDFWGVKPLGKIPKFDEMCSLVKKEHIKYPHNRLIGWDLTIDDNDEIICMEVNSLSPGIIQTQMVCGPIFSQKINGEISLYDDIKNYEIK